MGEGNSREAPELPAWVELLLWWEAVVMRALLGLRRPSLGLLEPWSLFLRSVMGLLAIPRCLSSASRFEGLPRRTSGSRDWTTVSYPSVRTQTRLADWCVSATVSELWPAWRLVPGSEWQQRLGRRVQQRQHVRQNVLVCYRDVEKPRKL